MAAVEQKSQLVQLYYEFGVAAIVEAETKSEKQINFSASCN